MMMNGTLFIKRDLKIFWIELIKRKKKTKCFMKKKRRKKKMKF